VAANLAATHDLPFLLSLLVGMVAVIPVSIVVGLPSLRARGAALAIATLGLASSINAVVLNGSTFTGGLAGLTLPTQTLFGWSIDATAHPRRYFFVAVAVFAVLATGVANLRRGRCGRRLLAVRNNERAARALGVNVVGAKLYAFTLAGMIAAAGGVLLTFTELYPQFGGFDPLTGLSNLLAVVLGGIGFVSGALLGGMFNSDGLPNAILNPVVGNLTWWTELFPLLIGVALVLQLIKNPDGIAAGPAALSRRRAARDSSRRAARRSRQASRRADTREASRIELERLLDAASSSDTPTAGSSLSVRGVRVVFGGTVALDGVDFDVRAGEVLAVIGPNGAGKTTLLDAITGFVPFAGTVQLDGHPIEQLPSHRRARAGVARSFQSLELFEDMTVMDNLRCAADPQDRRSMVLDLFHPSRGTLTPATVAAVDALGLRRLLDRLPTEIGYGDRRLVAVARALAGAPRVLLLDEPAAGLSEFERGELAQMITDVARKWNLAVVLIEHDVGLVREVADQVITLDFGRVIAAGAPDAVLSRPEVIQAYLGMDEDPAQPAPTTDDDRASHDTQDPTDRNNRASNEGLTPAVKQRGGGT
jgi:ABC-type branched-subunit amino acid transport system ATPase component/ABC-type branched-subunit amino acid transport system permease subunit